MEIYGKPVRGFFLHLARPRHPRHAVIPLSSSSVNNFYLIVVRKGGDVTKDYHQAVSQTAYLVTSVINARKVK